MAKKKREEEPGLIEQLREQIRKDDRSLNQLGKDTGVDASRLSRFLRGERGLSIEAIDSLFKVLRLNIVRRDKPGPKAEEK
jgi:hypothetical protein